MVGRPSQRFGRGWEALLKVPEWSGGPPGGPGVVGKPSWKSGSRREALREVREWSEGPLEGLGVVGRPSRGSVSGREALPMVREWSGRGGEALPEIRAWSGCPPKDPKVIVRPSLEVRQWSGGTSVNPAGTPGSMGVVGRPSQKSRHGREALPEVQERLGVLSGSPGVVGRPTRRSGSGWEALPEVREWSGGPPEVWE